MWKPGEKKTPVSILQAESLQHVYCHDHFFSGICEFWKILDNFNKRDIWCSGESNEVGGILCVPSWGVFALLSQVICLEGGFSGAGNILFLDF